MFLQRLNLFFFFVVILSILLLGYHWYQDYHFDNHPLSTTLLQKIENKKLQTRQLMKKNLGFDLNVPLIVSDAMPAHLYGATAYTKHHRIVIYLNKKRFKESSEYMINHVIPHEYAHAVMFYKGNFTNKKKGHGKEWQQICKQLNGIKCEQYVNEHDILLGKTSF
ncbi:SprT-like domain-containing protein [Candidatus Marinarcus aquaticus]|uniref:SprT domain-containing protein n=1 Tax=Candidatus Marinarcus aquaticus TaxID=2044504 RepID=A0A4Q0XTN9_9BACT|nr:SprT-like domain-containing protein [Candidatus Marinarcus aquaticus]RXJ60732.1 sprT domain-containing protein [Candidatus Marinarcus aquaticus]